MPKAAALNTSARDDFEEAIAALPHVRSGLPQERWPCPRCWWHLDIRIGSPDDDRDVKAENWHLACLIGRVLGENFLAAARRHPEYRQTMLRSTLVDMVRGGKVSGVEIGFIETVTEGLAPDVRGTNVTVLKARVTQPDGSRGVYETERN